MIRIYFFGALMLSFCVNTSCSQQGDSGTKPAISQEQQIKLLLVGGDQACESDESCHGAVCNNGRCIGVLMADKPWLQKRVAVGVAEKLRQDEDLRKAVFDLLTPSVKSRSSSIPHKARTIPLLEELRTYPLLILLAESNEPMLANLAALALCRLGHASQAVLCASLTEHEDLSLAVQAIDAMAQSGFEDALPILLSMLNPDLDRMLIRAGLQGLKTLNNPRAIRPLVGFLKDAPEFLHHQTIRTLRKLTLANLGQGTETWEKWVERNNPPDPPRVVLRTPDTTKVLGIPEP